MPHPRDYRHAIPPGLTTPERLAWWRRIVRELKQCSLAQRRATIASLKARAAQQAPLNRLESLWLDARRNPHHYPPHPIPGSTLCDL